MKLEEKLIVCAAPTSNFHGKEANPSFPIPPKRSPRRSTNAGTRGQPSSISHSGTIVKGDVLKAPVKTGMEQEVRLRAKSSTEKGVVRLRRTPAPSYASTTSDGPPEAD